VNTFELLVDFDRIRVLKCKHPRVDQYRLFDPDLDLI
jgi:hypothetical protein